MTDRLAEIEEWTALDEMELLWGGKYAHATDPESYSFPDVNGQEAGDVLRLIARVRELEAQVADMHERWAQEGKYR